MTLDVALHCVGHALTLVTTQCDARIDSDSILTFPALHPCIRSQKEIFLRVLNLTQRNTTSSVML